MKQQMGDDLELRRYLLGELAPDERIAIEAQLFLDGEYLLRLQATEYELIDDYVYDSLTEKAREEFETYFLAQPERVDDVRIARALRRYASSEAASVLSAPDDLAAGRSKAFDADPVPPRTSATLWSFLRSSFKRRPILSYAFVAVALIIPSGIAWVAIESNRRQERPAEAQYVPPQPNANEQRQPELTGRTPADEGSPKTDDAPVARQPDSENNARGVETGKEETARRQTVRPRKSTPPTPSPSTPAALAFLLSPGGAVREGGATDEPIPAPPANGSVILKLPLVEPDVYRSYRATLQTGTRTIHTWKDLKSTDSEAGKIVAVRVPARFLREQAYQIKLAGLTAGGRPRNLASYAFRVEGNVQTRKLNFFRAPKSRR